MSAPEEIKQLYTHDDTFRQVMAGKISVQSYFTEDQYKESKENFMQVFYSQQDFQKKIGFRSFQEIFFATESVAAAWITKLRFNEGVTESEFINYIMRSEEIFQDNGNDITLNFQPREKKDNDLCAIMWGIEALNGIQNFDEGATRVRLPNGVAPKLVHALEIAGANPRESTHATGTKLSDKGLGKDVANESLRSHTPRGVGAILVIPTSRDGTGEVKKVESTLTEALNGTKDYDLLLKREDYGYRDTDIHNHVHSKASFLNYRSKYKEQYTEGKDLIYKKSDLAITAETECGKGSEINRKEHLSELKGQAKTLVQLLEAGKKQGLFEDFKTTWAIRIKWPPWEKKIVSANSNSRKGLGDFLSQLADAERNEANFADKNKEKLDSVRELLSQASKNKFGIFEKCREGNEVLVNCEKYKPKLVDAIAKKSNNSPVNREALDKEMVSETNPDETVAKNLDFRSRYKEIKEPKPSEQAESNPENGPKPS